jgi:uncharacterized protein YjbI with pentapeptide repeats
MANEEHLAILKQGVEVWNEWRKSNKIRTDLNGVNLTGTDLGNADFSDADLGEANLSHTNLRQCA